MIRETHTATDAIRLRRLNRKQRMQLMGRAWWILCRRANRRGYRAGYWTRDETQGPPYLNIPMCQELIEHWIAGHKRGLEDYAIKHGLATPPPTTAALAKMKAAGGVQ